MIAEALMTGVVAAAVVLVALTPAVQALDALVMRLDSTAAEWYRAFYLEDRWGDVLAQVPLFLVEVWHYRLLLVT